MNTQALDNQFPHRISLSQAAELSGYHQDYLGQLCRLGKIKAAKIGRNWYTTKSELQSLLNFTDNIEVEAENFNTQVDVEEDKGLFDFSAPQLDEERPSLDSIGPQLAEMNIGDEASGEAVNDAIVTLTATPVVADNYVISEVDGIPIRLQADQANRQHHTIQTLVTRMKLDSLRSEVLQLTDVMQDMSDDLSAVKQLLAKHDEILRTRKDLATAYAASIDIVPEASVRERELLRLEDNSEPMQAPLWHVWLAPAVASFLIVALAGWMVVTNLPSVPKTFSTIKYPVINIEPVGQVAGDKDDSLLPEDSATINIDR